MKTLILTDRLWSLLTRNQSGPTSSNRWYKKLKILSKRIIQESLKAPKLVTSKSLSCPMNFSHLTSFNKQIKKFFEATKSQCIELLPRHRKKTLIILIWTKRFTVTQILKLPNQSWKLPKKSPRSRFQNQLICLSTQSHLRKRWPKRKVRRMTQNKTY